MKTLASKTNVIAPGGDYPFGSLKDETTPGANDGTPVNRELETDIHQFFEYLRLVGGVTANGLPDNGLNGFQTMQSLWEYLQTYANKHLINTLMGSYTANDVVILYGLGITFPGGLPGNGSYSGGAVFYNNKIYYVGADASVPVAVGETMVFDIKGDLSDGLYNSILLRGDTSGSGIADYDAATVKRYQDWSLRSNVADISATGGTGIVVNSSNIRYKLLGRTMHVDCEISISNTTAPTHINITIPESKSYSGAGFGFQSNVIVDDASGANTLKTSFAALSNLGPTIMKVYVLGLLTNATTTAVYLMMTFEVD